MRAALEQDLAAGVEGARLAAVVDAKHTRPEHADHELGLRREAAVEQRPGDEVLAVAPDRDRGRVPGGGGGELGEVRGRDADRGLEGDQCGALAAVGLPRDAELQPSRFLLVHAGEERGLDQRAQHGLLGDGHIVDGERREVRGELARELGGRSQPLVIHRPQDSAPRIARALGRVGTVGRV